MIIRRKFIESLVVCPSDGLLRGNLELQRYPWPGIHASVISAHYTLQLLASSSV